MDSVSTICNATKQRGNALVLLILLKTWDGPELPTREDLAGLAHIDERQVERDILKLIADGEVEKVGRRGVTTRFRVKGQTHPSDGHLTDVSDESDKPQTDMTDEGLTDSSEAPKVRTDVTVESDISVIPLSVSSDTSVRPLSGTEVAPLSAETTNKKDTQPSVEAGADAPPSRGKRKGRQPTQNPKPFDPRIKHPAIQAVRAFIHCLPDEQNRDEVITALGESPDMPKLAECYRVWKKQGFSKVSVAPATDWYVHGVPEKYLNGGAKSHAATNGHHNRKPTLTDRADEYADYFGGEQAADATRQNHR